MQYNLLIVNSFLYHLNVFQHSFRDIPQFHAALISSSRYILILFASYSTFVPSAPSFSAPFSSLM